MSAIAPETINPFALASLPLADRGQLPSVSAIYFVLKDDQVLYIGETSNLYQRWLAHHRWNQLQAKAEQVRIAWLECSKISLLSEIEKALIKHFQPSLNNSVVLQSQRQRDGLKLKTQLAKVRQKQINTLIEQLLNDQGIQSAPVPIEELARAMGVDVRYEPANDKLSGFLIRDLKHRRAVIGVNSSHHEHRQRFTIAHELGHFLLHEGEKVHIDRADYGFQVKLRNEDSSKGINIEEKEANLFAAELLMPQNFLKKDLKSVETLDLLDEEGLKLMAGLYRVSTQALTFRLAYLGYVQL